MVFITNVDRVATLQTEYASLRARGLEIAAKRSTPAIKAELDRLQSLEQRIVAELGELVGGPMPFRAETNFFLAESLLGRCLPRHRKSKRRSNSFRR